MNKLLRIVTIMSNVCRGIRCTNLSIYYSSNIHIYAHDSFINYFLYLIFVTYSLSAFYPFTDLL